MPWKGFLSAFALKLLMAALMVLDHIHRFLPPQPDWMTWLGRIVAPTFTFLMTQSLVHTRDRRKFIGRMACAGLLMLLGNLLVARVLGGPPIQNGIFLSLAVSAGIVVTFEQMAKEGFSLPQGLTLLGLCIIALYVEGGPLLPVMAVAFYFLRERPLAMCAGFALSATAITLLVVGITPQLLQVFAVIPILCYSGKRGSGGAFARWFFYIFYPVHVWILYAVSVLW